MPERKRPAHATAVLPAPGPSAAVAGATALPSRRRGNRGLFAAVAAVTIVLVVAVVFGVLHATGGSNPATGRSAPGSSTNTATPPPGIHLAATQVTGRPLDEVKAQLASMGLRVRPVPVTTASAPPGQVVAVDPTGELSPGETVTVSYAVAPPAPSPTPKPTPKPDHHGHGHGHGKGGGGD